MCPTIFISAGEASGEHYGALLIEALKRQLAESGQTATFFGMGGERMVAVGLDRVVRSEDMAVMGITEVIRHLPRIYSEFRKLKQAVRARRPDAAVLIDFPDIHFKLARELHRLGVPVIFFVSPQLWAWKKRRIKLVQKYVSRMLVIFPFEEQFYRERGVEAEFVGHPLAELPLPTISRAQFAEQHGLDPAATWIGLLPGSRPKEIRGNLPRMLEAARLLTAHGVEQAAGNLRTPGGVPEKPVSGAKQAAEKLAVLKGHGFSGAASWPNMDVALAAEGMQVENELPQGLKPGSFLGRLMARLKPRPFKTAEPFDSARSSGAGRDRVYQFLLPLAPTLNAAQRAEVQALVEKRGDGVPLRLVDDARAALYHARASVVASGTATVEAALIGNPFVVVYRVSRLTYTIAKRVVTVPHVAMANLIAGKRVVPELIQNDFTASKIVQQIEPLLPDGVPRESMMKELSAVGELLRPRQADKTGENTGAIERVAAITVDLIVPASKALDPSVVQS
jgi:lipid A disaccharide synthetase